MQRLGLARGKTPQAGRAPALASLLIGATVAGMTVLSAGNAWADCSNSGTPTKKVTCTDSDTDGHTIVLALDKLAVDVEAGAVVSRGSGDALNLGARNTLTITTAAGSSVQGGTSGHGILAYSLKGGSVTTLGDVSGALDAVNLTFSKNNVTYNNSGTITGGDAGVVINRELDEGKTTATNSGSILAGEDGMRINLNTGDGDVVVTNEGAIGNATTRVGDDGIDVNIKTSGEITITNSATGTIFAVDAGIDATNADGALAVTNLGTIDASGVAVNAYATTSVTIDNSGTLTGLGTGVRATVVAVADGDVTVTNDGVITTETDDPAGFAILARSEQAIQLSNNDDIHGTVQLGDVDGTPVSAMFDNDGFWDTSGDSALRALNGVTLNNTGDISATGVTNWTMDSTNGNTTFDNDGLFEAHGDITVSMSAVNGVNLAKNHDTIQVHGSLAFEGGSGLAFDNDGLIDMGDGATNGRTSVSGTFTGLVGSKMAIDVSLGGAGSEADQLFAGEATAGVTALVVQDSDMGPGGFNPDGIVFAYTPTGNSTLGDFVLDPTSSHYDASRGVLDKGLFFYDIATRPDFDNPQGVVQVLIGVPDAELLQAPRALTAAQTLWHETTGGWLERSLEFRREPTQHDGVAANSIGSEGNGAVATAPDPVERGVWAKVIGSHTSRSDGESFSVQDQAYTFDVGYEQDVTGAVAGIDFTVSGLLGATDRLVVGAMAGYVSSNLDFNASQNGFDMSGVTAGLYASYLNEGFFIDVLAKADMLSSNWGAPSLAGMGTTTLSGDMDSYGMRADTGFRFTLNPAVYIEPSATLASVHTEHDSLMAEGATFDFHGGQNVRGALGLRVGAQLLESEDHTLEASISGRIWRALPGANRVGLDSSGTTLDFDDEIQGTFGEVTGSLDLLGPGSGWSGVVSGGVTFADAMITTAASSSFRYEW